MSVTGIICEYDPLHTGHAWLMARAREAGASAVVCAMSGNFTPVYYTHLTLPTT